MDKIFLFCQRDSGQHPMRVPKVSSSRKTSYHQDWGSLSATNSLDVKHMTLEDIIRKLESGELTSVELVQHYLDRISAYEDRGPRINALISLNSCALKIAEDLDEERHKEGARSRIHGIPIVVKDTIEVAGMPYTLGHPILADFDPGRDAQVIKRLRDAGAIILAKANLTDILGTLNDAESSLITWII